jgi:subtilisin family serine protease
MSGFRMNRLISLLVAALLLLAGAAQAQNEILVRTSGPINSQLLARYNLTFLSSDDRQGLYRLRLPAGASAASLLPALAQDGSVLNAEVNSRVSLPAPVPLDQSTASVLNRGTVSVLNQSTVSVLDQSTVSVLDALLDRKLVSFYGSTVMSGYLKQPAMKLIENDQAHSLSTGIGVVIADINNGVDPQHAALKGALVPGFNFTNNSSNVSVFAGLNQSTVSVLDDNASVNQSTVSVLDQSTVSVLDQSTVAVLDQSTVSVLKSLPPAWGHGTQVAGILHLVAPGSRIMPLKAFNADGTGQLFDVVRAIYYAADMGARVINMSFSCDCSSRELASAISYAWMRGVVLVASVGNNGSNVSLFPATYSQVIGVASTNLDDTPAPFTNYGPSVDVAAPGAGIISTFPGGKWAAGWGTSFSAPMVAGEAALLLQRGVFPFVIQWRITAGTADITQTRGYKPIGHGRIDLLKALSAY